MHLSQGLTFLSTSLCRRRSSGRSSNSLSLCVQSPPARAKAKYTDINCRAGKGNRRRNVLSVGRNAFLTSEASSPSAIENSNNDNKTKTQQPPLSYQAPGMFEALSAPIGGGCAHVPKFNIEHAIKPSPAAKATDC